MATRRATAAGSLAVLVDCSVIGASQVTLTARNDSDGQMVVQVISGQSDGDPPHGEPRTIEPGSEEWLTLSVPGGSWTVTVNGSRLMGSSDAGTRRGKLPVTLILSEPDEFPLGPHWEARAGWAEVGS